MNAVDPPRRERRTHAGWVCALSVDEIGCHHVATLKQGLELRASGQLSQYIVTLDPMYWLMSAGSKTEFGSRQGLTGPTLPGKQVPTVARCAVTGQAVALCWVKYLQTVLNLGIRWFESTVHQRSGKHMI